MTGDAAVMNSRMSPIKTLGSSLTEKLSEVKASKPINSVTACVGDAVSKGKEIASSRSVQVTAASGVAGTAVGGAGGAALGVFFGGTLGAVLGLLPALFTFGLSVPLGAICGGGAGLVVGTTMGGTVGLVAASSSGYGVYTHREKIRDALASVVGTFRNMVSQCRSTISSYIDTITMQTRNKANTAVEMSKQKLLAAKELAADKGVQVGAVSAAGGAVVMGAGGAATGLTIGGALGALVGVVPAIFTLGLSIPVCSAIGGSIGFAAGTACGGAAGFVSGGAVGYSAYTRRETIGSGVSTAWNKVASIKDRLVGGTGGTMD